MSSDTLSALQKPISSIVRDIFPNLLINAGVLGSFQGTLSKLGPGGGVPLRLHEKIASSSAAAFRCEEAACFVARTVSQKSPPFSGGVPLRFHERFASASAVAFRCEEAACFVARRVSQKSFSSLPTN